MLPLYFQVVFEFALFETTVRLNRERFPEDTGESSPGRGCQGFSRSVLAGVRTLFKQVSLVLSDSGEAMRSCLLFQALPGNILVGIDLSIHSPYLLPSIPAVPTCSIFTLLVPLSLSSASIPSSPYSFTCPPIPPYYPWTSKSAQRVFATSIPGFVAQTLFPNLLPRLYFPCS